MLPLNGGSSENSNACAGGEAALLTLEAGDCPAMRRAGASLLSDADVLPGLDAGNPAAELLPAADGLLPTVVLTLTLGGVRIELGVSAEPAVTSHAAGAALGVPAGQALRALFTCATAEPMAASVGTAMPIWRRRTADCSESSCSFRLHAHSIDT